MVKSAFRFQNGLIALMLLYPAIVFSQNKISSEDPRKTKNPIINYAEWSDTDASKLYSNCVIALHLCDIDIEPVKTSYGKQVGLIYSTTVNRIQSPDFKTSYSLSFLVFKTNENKTAIHIQFNDPKIVIGNSYAGRLTANEFNNIIGETINEFFKQLELYQGKPLLTRTTTSLEIPF